MSSRSTLTTKPEYAFGDSEQAAQRLGFLAGIFNDTTGEFMMRAGKTRPSLALDLGCGPGYTTHRMAEVMSPDHTVGLDKSESFIARARGRESDGVSFLLHDVTSTPFPAGPADVAFCRSLLTHLENPVLALASWADCLKPGGLFLLEELERIETDNPVFARYLEISDAMLGAQGHRLYIGPILDSITQIGSMRQHESGVASLRVSEPRAAKLFSMNLCSWKDVPYVRENFEADEIRDLENSLYALAKQPAGNGVVTWGQRQIVFERT